MTPMYSEARRLRILLPAAALVLLTACATPDHSPQIAYHEAESERPLELPPDLVRREAVGALRIPGIDGEVPVLPEFPRLEMVRAGDLEWIEVPGVDPADIWPRLPEFFRKQGLAVQREARELGIVESGWAERHDGPRPGGITRFLAGIFGGDPVYDRYQVRLERMAGGAGTRIFLSHWDASEERVGGEGPSRDSAEYRVRHGRGDPAVRAEMTRRLLLHLGISEARAQALMADDAVRRAFAPAIHFREGDRGRGEAYVPRGDHTRVRAEALASLNAIQADLTAADDETATYRVNWVPPGREGRGGIFGIGRRAAEEFEIELRFEDAGDEVRIRAADVDAEVSRQFVKYLVAALGGDVDVEPLAPDRQIHAPRPSGDTGTRQQGRVTGR